ncbi:MAG: diguanylate cyclase [Pseudomonadota bacterium]
MLVKDVIAVRGNSDIWTMSPDRSLHDMASLLRAQRIGAIVVLDEEGSLAGVASERDLVAAIADGIVDFVGTTISEIMTRTVITCRPEDELLETLETMTRHRIRHIPVMKDGRPITMISLREMHLACRELQELASTDPLTGLANRREFMTILDNEIKRHRRFHAPFAVAMLDIDHFKSVNDTYGHDVGDEVLKTLASRLTDSLRAYDVVGRLGGEEFAVIFPSTEFADGASICERLLGRIRDEPIETAAGPLQITASVGMTSSMTANANGRDYLKKADELLYLAKGSGRDRLAADAFELAVVSEPPTPAVVFS